MSELLSRLQDLQLEKLRVETLVMEEKAVNAGTPKNSPKRDREFDLVHKSQTLLLEIVETKKQIRSQGEPVITITDTLSSLYAIEALFSAQGNYSRAWDALSGVLDGLEQEFERVGK